MCYWDKLVSFCDGKSPPDCGAWLPDSVTLTAMVQGFGCLQMHVNDLEIV